MSNHKATPKQWAEVGVLVSATRDCILELRARVEALETQANHISDATKMVPPLVTTDEERLMDRVSIAIMSVEDDDDDDDPSLKYTSAAIRLGMDVNSLQARAAILEQAKWLREQGWKEAGILLEREALPND